MAPTAPTIRISAKPKKAVPVELVGTNYSIKPPKASLLLAISDHSAKKGGEAGVISNDLRNILKLMFGPKNWEAVQARLEDPEDELDIDHIFEAVEAVTEESTGNPTS